MLPWKTDIFDAHATKIKCCFLKQIRTKAKHLNSRKRLTASRLVKDDARGQEKNTLNTN